MSSFVITNTGYSRKDFTGRKLLGAKDLDGQTITNSCFSQEEPGTEVFPADVQDLTLEYCNLDNVVIPKGVTLVECSNRRYKVQNDGHDWEVDEDNNPVRLLNYIVLTKRGIEQPQPTDIPSVKVKAAVDYTDASRNVRAG